MKHFPKEFDMLPRGRSERRVGISSATIAELSSIYPLIANAFSNQLASLAVCERIRARHPDNIWSIRDHRTGAKIGLFAMAMLTRSGHDALLDGKFAPRDPLTAHTAGNGDDVAAIYMWGVYAPGTAAAAIPLIAHKLNSPAYRKVDLYGNGSTLQGRNIMRALGFEQVSDQRTPYLFHYERLSNRGAYLVPSSSPEKLQGEL